jgi:hypothetical protein
MCIAIYSIPLREGRSLKMYSREECLRAALRVLSYFSRLTRRPPTSEDLASLKECADSSERDSHPEELARTVIHNNI